VYLRVGDPDGVQEEHKQFILVQAEECHTSSVGEESCIILHRSVCSKGYKRVRVGGDPRSREWSVCVGFGGVFSPSAFLFFSCPFSLSSPPGMVPAFPFYRCKGSTGLQVKFLREKRYEISGPVVGGVLLLGEWPPSSDAIATCPDGRSPVATKCRIMIITVTTCLSLWLDRRREPRPQWRESWRDFTPLEGTLA
jgi:hypothetical protein